MLLLKRSFHLVRLCSPGELTVSPDFTWNSRPYTLELEGSTWQLWIQHASKVSKI